MSLQLYNSISRKKEPFTSIHEKEVKLYTCGPTVYDVAHIGNLRTYLFEDLLHRTLTFFGYEVKQVMNITDIDDKTLRGALKLGVDLNAFTHPFKKIFFEDLKALNIAPAQHYPEATAHIPQMIEMIEQLLKGGFAYQSKDQSIYFSVKSFPDYGRLARLVPGAMRTGGSNRIDLDEYDKQQMSDFALWKAYDRARDGKIYWQSPWGRGRPGWHIECSAMARHFFGDTLDIHAGGVDNIFPHHENEIAQSQCCNNQPLARYWLHAQHLRIENSKMSKSLGNFYTLGDLIKRGFDPMAFRLLMLQNHYRTPINFTLRSLQAAAGALQRLQTLQRRLEKAACGGAEISKDALDISKKLMVCVKKGLADDLNASASLAGVFEWSRAINAQLDGNFSKSGDAEHYLSHFQTLDQLLGLFPQRRKDGDANSLPVPEAIWELVGQRQQARSDRNWNRADQLRREIEKLGYLLLDTAAGSEIKKA